MLFLIRIVCYIQAKKDNYDEGENIDQDNLMTLAENKYKALVVEEKWNSLSGEQNQIVSLTAEVKKLKESCLQLGNKGKSNDKKKSDNTTQSGDSKFKLKNQI